MNPRRRIKRAIKLSILHLCRALGLFRLSRWITRNSFVVIGWHGVSIGDEHQRLPEYFLQPETLRRRLEYLSDHFRIVSLDEALRQRAAGRIESGQVVLTFDDGMLDLRRSALPELRKANAPATVYIVSDTLKRRLSIALNLLVREAFLTTTCTDLAGNKVEGLSTLRWCNLDERLAAAAECYATMEAMDSYEERCAYAKPLVEGLGMRWDDVAESGVWSLLSPTDIREMIPLGVDFQLHSHMHETVNEMGERLDEDTRRCRSIIEGVTQRTARDYCYPSGLWGRWCWAALQAAGVRSAVTCKLGPNFPETPELALRRYVDTNLNTQIEFEALASNFLWLLHVIRQPSRWRECSEAPSVETSLI